MQTTKVKVISLKEWLTIGERLFGPDKTLWKWKCPNCGHVQTIADFIELRELGMIAEDKDVGTIAYYSCIGRFDTRIKKEDIGTIFNKKKPCDYTLGGLFCFANMFVIDEIGNKRPVFEFAE